MQFRKLKDLYKQIQVEVVKVMEKDVAESIKDVQQQKVYEKVYSAHSPSIYSKNKKYTGRRGEDGGLADKQNMISSVNVLSKRFMELSVKNITDGNPNVDYTDLTVEPDYLAGIIEYGREPDRKGLYTKSKNGDGYLKPRPFIQATIDELKVNKAHLHELIEGLRNNGIKVKD